MKDKSMEWNTFCYLNGSRRTVDAMIAKIDEMQCAFNSLGIAASKGELEKAFQEQSAGLARLSVLLMKRVQHERQKDISLYLEDL